MKALLSSAYLAPVEYYAWMLAADEVLLEQHDHYVKQTYRNRCIIAAADGPLSLTVPIVKPETEKCEMKDIRISDHGNWRHLHWNALKSAYRMSPFWEYYEDDYSEEEYSRTTDFSKTVEPSIQDLREVIHPKKEIASDGKFKVLPYYQVFQERQGFLPNMSIMDLLMNMGPESLLILRDSLK